MKRHKSLYPLSHDHHHALVWARRLNLAARQSGMDDSRVTAEEFFTYWEGDLQKHFRREEEILLPGLEKFAGSNVAEVRETLRQHGGIRQLIGTLNEELTQPAATDAGLLGQIGVALTDHIRFEERVLFPLVEVSVPEQALWELNEQLRCGA